MKYFFIFFLFCSTRLLAQEQTYDIVTFTLPDGWSKGEENNAAIQYVKKEGTKWFPLVKNVQNQWHRQMDV